MESKTHSGERRATSDEEAELIQLGILPPEAHPESEPIASRTSEIKPNIFDYKQFARESDAFGSVYHPSILYFTDAKQDTFCPMCFT